MSAAKCSAAYSEGKRESGQGTMSRVGKNPVAVPQGVDGPDRRPDACRPRASWASCRSRFSDEVDVALDDGKVSVKPANDSKQARMMWGTARNTDAATWCTASPRASRKQLEINGVGYRAAVAGQDAACCSSATATTSLSDARRASRSSASSRRRSRSPAPTSSGSARSRPRSAASASPSPTRARASIHRRDDPRKEGKKK